MTNTYNTLNPLGSTSPKDLFDNASNFDEAMNSTAPSFYDRFKKRRETWAGMEKQVNDFLESMGFEATHLQYVDGTPLTVLRPTQLIDHAPSVYKVKAPATFPVNLTGTWATDQLLLVDVGDVSLRLDLANAIDPAKGAGMIGYRGRTVFSKLDDSLNLKDFGAVGDGVADDTAAINLAVAACCALNLTLLVPSGTYRLVPATTKTDEAGTNICAIEMFSNLHIEAVDGATFKITDNFSTDASPKRHSMFFTNQVINNISFSGLTMDMNGQNNKMSPARPVTYNGFTNAQIIVSGTPGGIGARADYVRIDRCKFINNAGVSCIVAQQSNTIGVQLSDDWIISRSLFSEVGLDSADHSSIYGQATRLRVFGNVFINSVPQNPTTHIGGLVACELHCSESIFTNNIIVNYFQGLWVAANFTETLSSGFIVANNKARVSGTFIDFFSHNILPYGDPEGALQSVSITGNVIEITADPTAIAVKSFLKIGARLQPTIVDFSGNVCRSFDAVKETVLCLAVVGPNQLAKPNQITIRDNTCAGVTNGLVCYFGGDGATATTQNIGNMIYQDNDLGVLLPSLSAGYPAADIYLYGPSAGKLEGLRVSGAQKVDTPIVTDSAVGGRARVYGQAIVPQTVTWNGVTIGNGSKASKIALDTDAGIAVISASLTAGSTSSGTGSIYPQFSGLTADAQSGATATHVKTGAAISLAARIDNGASWFTIFNAAGSAFGAADFAVSSVISVSANFPCRFAEI